METKDKYQGCMINISQISRYERLVAFVVLITSESKTEIKKAYKILQDGRSGGAWLCTCLKRDGYKLKD